MDFFLEAQVGCTKKSRPRLNGLDHNQKPTSPWGAGGDLSFQVGPYVSFFTIFQGVFCGPFEAHDPKKWVGLMQDRGISLCKQHGLSNIFFAINVGVSKNSDTPKWMVYFMENPIKMDDLGVPLLLETPMWILLPGSRCYTSQPTPVWRSELLKAATFHPQNSPKKLAKAASSGGNFAILVVTPYKHLAWGHLLRDSACQIWSPVVFIPFGAGKISAQGVGRAPRKPCFVGYFYTKFFLSSMKTCVVEARSTNAIFEVLNFSTDPERLTQHRTRLRVEGKGLASPLQIYGPSAIELMTFHGIDNLKHMSIHELMFILEAEFLSIGFGTSTCCFCVIFGLQASRKVLFVYTGMA